MMKQGAPNFKEGYIAIYLKIPLIFLCKKGFN
jgi:hypothetical protein